MDAKFIRAEKSSQHRTASGKTGGSSPKARRPLWAPPMGLVVLLFWITGCAFSTQLPATPSSERSGLDQLLVVRSLERAVAQLDFKPFAGRRVALTLHGLTGDQSYAQAFVSSELQSHGAKIATSETDADVQLNVFLPALGVDHAETLYGLPSIPTPLGFSLPELAIYKSIRDRGYGEIKMYAFDSRTGRMITEEVLKARGNAKYSRYTILLFIHFTLSDVEKVQG